MNSIITFLMIGTMCVFGTKLELVNSEFTQLLPGVASADIVTKFSIEIQSTGNKIISIESIWLKNETAKWKIKDNKENEVLSISGKNKYTLTGEVRTKSNNAKTKSKLQTVAVESPYEEEFVVVYKVGDSNSTKFLKIEKIENSKQIRAQ